MRKQMLGITLVLFGFNCTYVAIQAGWNGLDVLGVGISLLGLILSVLGYSEKKATG